MSEINQDINALVQADIDGVITEDERERLQGYLESMEEVRAYHQDCLKMAEALDGLESLEPPPGLDDAILALHRQPAESSGEEPGGGWRRLFDTWFSYPVLRYAAAFFLGALMTSVLSDPVRDASAIRTAALVGSMSPVPEFSLLETQYLERASLKLRFDLLGSEDLLQLRIEVESEAPLEVQVRYLASAYQLFGISQQSGALVGLSAGDGRVTLQAQGEQDFAVFLSQLSSGEGEFEVTLRRDGQTLETLSIPSSGVASR